MGIKLKPIEDQVVVIVGASSGMGRDAALQFARRGAKVVVAARSQEGLDSLVNEIKGEHGEATAIAADVSNFNAVQAIAGKALERYGRVDTWVHLAAVSIYATFEETTPEEFKRIIDVNLLGAIYSAKVALPLLRQSGGGALIQISSVEGKRAFPLQSAYASSKHGMVGYLDALRTELKHEGAPISVTNIMPAGINTPFFNKARTKMGVKPMPAAPIYQPEMVTAAILYAAEHPVAEIFVGGAGKFFELAQKVSPRLVDTVMARIGYQIQQTDEPKPADAPDNLFKTLNGYNKIKGDFDDQARSSVYTWLAVHPVVKQLALGAALTFTASYALGLIGPKRKRRFSVSLW